MKHDEAPNELETPQQLADRVGVSVANIRQLIRIGRLDHIFLSPGRRNPKIPNGAWERYLETFTVRATHPTVQSEKGEQT